MNDLFDIFGVEDESAASPYAPFGLPRNPFRKALEEQTNDSQPFYRDHIIDELKQIQGWITSVHKGDERQPLSIIGNIGAGKTRILRHLERSLARSQASEKILVKYVTVSETGFTRASIGGLLINVLESTQVPGTTVCPNGVFPLIWAVVNAHELPSHPTMMRTLIARIRAVQRKDLLAGVLTRWLQRAPLSASEAKSLDLYRRIDWEGELLRYICDLLRLACDAGVLRTFFLLIDQLEDLFRPTFSELRRSRLLTDLRGLIDEIDAGVPIGLVLSWTPDFSTTSKSRYVETQLKLKYEALYARMHRREVNLPLLRSAHVRPFAEVWIASLDREEGFDSSRLPPRDALAAAAWTRMTREGRILPAAGGGVATPRDVLSALAEELDRMAGLIN